MYRIEIPDPASRDIESIINYNKNILQNPQAAEEHLAAIEDGIRGLKTLPFKYQGSVDEYLTGKNIHCFTVKNYYVFYRIDEQQNTVSVI